MERTVTIRYRAWVYDPRYKSYVPFGQEEETKDICISKVENQLKKDIALLREKREKDPWEFKGFLEAYEAHAKNLIQIEKIDRTLYADRTMDFIQLDII